MAANQGENWYLLEKTLVLPPSSLPPCLVFSCTPHCPPPPPPSLGSNEADEARSKMTSYFLRPQENDVRCGGDNLMYDCKWASDGELMCRGSSGQEGADLTSRCITLVPPLLMVTTHLYFLLTIGHLPFGQNRRKRKFLGNTYSGFVYYLPVNDLNTCWYITPELPPQTDSVNYFDQKFAIFLKRGRLLVRSQRPFGKFL